MTVRAETEITLARVNDGDNGVKVYDGTAGSVVTVSNASAYPALELVADIIPIQPNDYDSVWVGGAGKNVCVPLEGTKNGIIRTLNDDGTVAITGTSTANSWSYLEEYYDLPYCGIDVGDTISIYSDVYLVVMAYNGSTSLGSKQSKDGTAATYTIPTNTTRLRILQYPKSVQPIVDEEFDTTAKYWVSKSAFSSWEPYENICPIYGHDHCTITRIGKNLITMDPSASASYSSNDITWTKVDGNTIHVQGTASAQSNCALTSDWGKLFHAVLPAGTYRASTDSDVRLRVGTGANNTNKGNAYGGFSFTITESTDVWLGLFVSSGANINKDVTVQLEQGSTATTFEPYKGIEYTTNFPQTVYGGTLDVVKGTLTVTHGYEIVDGNHTMSNQISARDRVFFQLTAMESGSHTDDGYNKCNQMIVEQNTGNTFTYPNIRLGANNNYVYLNGVKEISGVTDLASLKTWLNSNPVTFTYPLATPIVYSVQPMDIELITGTCNVWATTGDITDFRYAEIAPATLETFGDARKIAVKYVTDMGDDGIIVHPENDSNDYAKINAEGMEVVVDGRSVAKYGVDARIGEENGGRMLLDSESFKIVAENGAEAFLLSTGSSQVQTKVYASLQLHADPNKTDTGECYDLGSVSNGTSFDVRIKTYASYYNDGEYKTHTFTKGTSATYSFTITPPIVSPPTYTVQVAYDGNKGFTITNGASRYYVEINELSYMKTVDKVVITLRNSPLADFVVDEGYDAVSGWKWRKWESGKVEAWYHDQTYPDGWQTKINTSANGGFYISENIDVPDYPSGLFDPYGGEVERHATATAGDNYFVIALIGNYDNYDPTQNFGEVYWATVNARSSYHTYYIDLYAVQHP